MAKKKKQKIQVVKRIRFMTDASILEITKGLLEKYGSALNIHKQSSGLIEEYGRDNYQRIYSTAYRLEGKLVKPGYYSKSEAKEVEDLKLTFQVNNRYVFQVKRYSSYPSKSIVKDSFGKNHPISFLSEFKEGDVITCRVVGYAWGGNGEIVQGPHLVLDDPKIIELKPSDKISSSFKSDNPSKNTTGTGRTGSGSKKDLSSVKSPRGTMVPVRGIDFSSLNSGLDSSLRDYQIKNKLEIYKAWERCRGVMLQMPTGTGKTRLFVSITRDVFDYGILRHERRTVLLLAHRKELIEQIINDVTQKYNMPCGVILSQNMEQQGNRIQVASVPTLTRRLDRWKDKRFDVIIIDEAHHVKAESYKKIIDAFPDSKILGVTATPYRLNGAGFHPEFDELIISPSVSEFIKRNFLCDYDYYSIPYDSRLQNEIDHMKKDFTGDYKESEMMGVMDRDYIRANILDTYQRFASGKKGIVYTINRDHNIHLCEKFTKAGIKSAAIDSKTPKEEREDLVKQFRVGKIQVLFNVNIFSEGFDCPDVEVIQLARPTKSLSMYLQQVGRGLRPAKGKDKVIILDNVGLYNRFGFPSANRKWKYHFEGKDVDESPAAHYLETNDADRVVKPIFEGDDVVEKLHSSEQEEVEISSGSVYCLYKEDFISYAAKSFDEQKVRGIIVTIEQFLDNIIKYRVNPSFSGLFNTVDLQLLDRIHGELQNDASYIKVDRKNKGRYSGALDLYIDFARWYNAGKEGSDIVSAEYYEDDVVNYPGSVPEPESGNEIVEEEEPNDNKRKQLFKKFLDENGYQQDALKMVDVLSSVDVFIKQLINKEHTSLFDVVDPDKIRSLNKSLKSTFHFSAFDKMKHNLPGKVLVLYMEFAEKNVPEGRSKGISSSVPSNQRTEKIKEKSEIVCKAIKEKLKECGLDGQVSFEYDAVADKINVISPVADPSLEEKIEAAEKMISSMKVLGLDVPEDYVTLAKNLTDKAKLLSETERFCRWLSWYVSFNKRETIGLKSISVASDDSISVRFE